MPDTPTPPPAPRVLLLCSRRPVASEFALLAERLVQRGYRPVLVLPFPEIEALLLEDQSPDVDRFRVYERASTGAWITAAVHAGLRRLGALLGKAGLRFLSDFVLTSEGLSRGRWAAARLIGEAPVAAVLTGDDRDLRADAGFLSYARERRIPAISVAFAKSDYKADAGRRASDLAHLASHLPKDAGARHPKLFRDDGGKVLSFVTAGELAALERFDAMLPVPWSYGGGRADKVTVIEDADRDAAVALGVPAQKIVVVGQCSHDVLHDRKVRAADIRRSVFTTYGFAESKPLIVCSLPALGEHTMSTQSSQQADSEFLFAALAASGANILISLHPRQKRANYEPLAQTYGVAIAYEPLRDVLSAADLFVAYSSTLAWAVLLDVPAVALEYYDLGYRLFDTADGMAIAAIRDELAGVIDRALHDETFRSEMAARRREARRGVPFDGRCRDRIVDLIDQLKQRTT